MNNKLLIETLESAKGIYNSVLLFDNPKKEIKDKVKEQIQNIDTLLSELKEPSLEEQMREFESQIQNSTMKTNKHTFSKADFSIVDGKTNIQFASGHSRDMFHVWQIARGYK